MARSEIAEKVQELLTTTEDWSEIEVVYFLVQVRKLLDYVRTDNDSTDSFRILHFYCDWIVHIRKDAIGSEMIAVLDEVEKSICDSIGNPSQGSGKAINFAYFESLRPELLKLLAMESVDTTSLENDIIWVSLIANLVKVLENQPLHLKQTNTGLNIKEVVFMPSAPNCVIIVFRFFEPVTGKDGKPYSFFRLMNAY
jgi:hypothetical protein